MSNQTLLLLALAVVVALVLMQKPARPGVLVDDAAAEKDRTALQKALATRPMVHQARTLEQKPALLPVVNRVGTRWVVT